MSLSITETQDVALFLDENLAPQGLAQGDILRFSYRKAHAK